MQFGSFASLVSNLDIGIDCKDAWTDISPTATVVLGSQPQSEPAAGSILGRSGKRGVCRRGIVLNFELPFDRDSGLSGCIETRKAGLVFADELNKSPRLGRFGAVETVLCCAVDVCFVDEMSQSLVHCDGLEISDLDLKLENSTFLERNYPQTDFPVGKEAHVFSAHRSACRERRPALYHTGQL